MFLAYFMLFLSLESFSQNKIPVQVLPNAETAEDFEHQNKGCPENSECDQVMGMQLKRWNDLITKLKEQKKDYSQKFKELETFRANYGIPTEFYTYKKSQQGFKPLYFNSPCKAHNPPKEDERVLKGIAFVKSVTKETALVWRDQAQIEVPTKELFISQPVNVYAENGVNTYYLPLSDQPLFIKEKALYVVREDNDFFYALKISSDGQWSIVNLDFTRLSEWENKKDNVTCPTDKNKTAPGIFGAEFCRSIWDEDLKKNVVVKMHQGCSI